MTAIQLAYENGINCIGESRIQETEEKLANLSIRDSIEVHLIGHLQSNKARKALQLYDVIQTIDSIKLAQKISIIAKEINKIQRIYIQINVGNEPQKKGFSFDESKQAALEISQLDNVVLEGIMMMPPFIDMNDAYRKLHSKTRKLRDELLSKGIQTCKNLSMGMSRDFEIAIEEGATHLRIGSGLFGQRP